MRVALDLSAAVQGRAGLGRYAEELARALVAFTGDEPIRLFYTDPQGRLPAPPLDALPRRTLRWSTKPWRLSALVSSYTRLPMDSLLGEADLFHATEHLLPNLRRMRSVFTLHDLIFLKYPETHLPLNRWFLTLMMPRFLRRADAVICVSQWTKDDAVRAYGLDPAKLVVIPEGVDPRFRPVEDAERLAAVRARYQLPERFILCVGTIEPRKNLVALWEAYRQLRQAGRSDQIVVVGRKGWLYEETFARLRALGLEDAVIFPGYVADEDLPVLYSLATCFCFPSLYEGFGLPPLEAMAAGCPVVCSDSSSLPEVCGDAAVLVAPSDVAGLTAALARVLDDGELRAELRGRGLRQAARFTWSETARQTWAVYQSVLQAHESHA